MKRTIAVIDLKSFYASCECACRHLDPFSTPLVCCDPYRSGSSVVMSVSPFLKERYGIPNVCRRRDLPDIDGMIYAIPRMSYYLKVSAKVLSIFLDYVALEDIHVYSVDESFLDLTSYLSYYRCSPETIVKRIQGDIKRKLGITATAGISENMFLAKCALDKEGKKRSPFIANWKLEEGRERLQKFYPLDEIWGIAEGISARLHRRGIRSLKDLAASSPDMLKREFGIMGEQLYGMSNGIDHSRLNEKYEPVDPSLTLGQTLNRDYRGAEISLLVREMGEELAVRLRAQEKLAGKVSLMLGYSDGLRPFSRQRSLAYPTDDTSTLVSSLLFLLRGASGKLPIRSLSIAFGKLIDPSYEQLSLFEDVEENDRRRRLARATDAIHSLFGRDSLVPCSALTKASTLKMRHGQIGGHKQ